MDVVHRHHRWAWPALAITIVLALVTLLPALGHTKTASGPLWTDRLSAAPAPATVTAPNWAEIARLVKPAVVNVSTKRQPEPTPMSGDDFFKPFFGDQPRRPVRSLGSGFVINSTGYVVTNNHVVDGASEVRVKLSDGRDVLAKVAGRDPKTDLALLKVEATGLPVIPLGDSAQLQVGEPVMAIGNPFGLEQTVTTGIVSATGRVIGEGPYDDFIQTDASINPGNSGGPLINSRGQVVGINTAIFSQSGGSVGIGFAIPVNLAKGVVTQLAESGHVVRGWLGVEIQPITPELAKGFNLSQPAGALVASVVDGSPAKEAGVKPGDVITEFDGRKVGRAEDLPRAVADTTIGREVVLGLVRDGKPTTVKAVIGELQDHPAVAAAGSPSVRPTLGVAVQPFDPTLARELGLKETRGVVVREVRDGSPAATAGVRPGDVISEVDRHQIAGSEDLRQALQRHDKRAPLLLTVHRGEQQMYVAVTL
ncbi:MAG TPA: DegQ family serine endoprotease [Methylomirabilota bacterium]